MDGDRRWREALAIVLDDVRRVRLDDQRLVGGDIFDGVGELVAILTVLVQPGAELVGVELPLDRQLGDLLDDAETPCHAHDELGVGDVESGRHIA